MINKKNLSILFCFSQIFLQLWFVFDYDLTSVRFLPRVTSLLFIALIVNALFFSISFAFLKKKYLFFSIGVGFLVTNILVFFTLYQRELFGIQVAFTLNQLLSDQLINNLISIKFINVSVSDGNLSWAIALSFYLGVGLLIYGQWFVKGKLGFEHKVEKQLIFLGLGLYLALFPFVFVFTHFTFVGSNYQYIQGILQYTNNSVSVYEKTNQTEHFQIKDLRYFKNIDEVVKYYEDNLFKREIQLSKNKKDFYETAMSKIIGVQKYGWSYNLNYEYDNMERFQDWVQIAYNFKLDGQDNTKRTLWYSEISPVLSDPMQNEQDLLRHSVLYLHEAKDGGCYAMISFDRTFKDHKMNYIFNVFFILYHIIYLGLFVYLITIHSKKNLSKKRAV